MCSHYIGVENITMYFSFYLHKLFYTFVTELIIENMRFLKNDSTDPYFNMAFDEYCLESLPIDEPVFYLWQNRPSVIMGLNQEVNTEVNLEFLKENDIALVRRVTGGGAVYHDLGNLNYTIVGRSEDLERDYPEYAAIMMRALQSMGVAATLSGRNDILVDGKKVSGFAKRVCRNRLMVHGTLMYDVNLEQLTQALCPPATKLESKGIASVRSRVTNLRECMPHITDIQTLKGELEKILSNQYTDKEYTLHEGDMQLIQKLADDKYAQWEWIYGRSPKATLHHSQRMACGTVEVNLTLAENRIASLRWGGDFLGNLPVNDVEVSLTGIPYEYEAIMKALQPLDVSQYFDGVQAEELTQILLYQPQTS